MGPISNPIIPNTSAPIYIESITTNGWISNLELRNLSSNTSLTTCNNKYSAINPTTSKYSFIIILYIIIGINTIIVPTYGNISNIPHTNPKNIALGPLKILNKLNYVNYSL